MKARTKAARIKAKRGRPLKDVDTREPNGRASRRQTDMAKEARSVVLNKRIRDAAERGVSLSKKAADDPRRGYVMGLMLLDKTISQAEHDAGLKFAMLKRTYYETAGIPMPSAQAQNVVKVHGMIPDETPDRATHAKEIASRYMGIEGALLSIPGCQRYALHAVNEVAFLDNEMAREWPAHMIDYLRRGLRELVFRFGLDMLDERK